MCEASACRDCNGYSSSPDEEEGVPLVQGNVGDDLPTYWPEPYYYSSSDIQLRANDNCYVFKFMMALTIHLSNYNEGDTICEIVGGEARTTKFRVRYHDKRPTGGPNFDLVADVVLTNPREQQA